MPSRPKRRAYGQKRRFNTMKFKLLKIFWFCVFCLVANNCCVSSDSDKLTKKLKNLEKTIPLPYHERLDRTVQSYANKPLPDAFVVSEPFLDSALSQRNMPQELKYLPLALSAMRTDYANGDRCGVWSLPSLVAMRYGLPIEEEFDERYAIRASTNAALDYLNDLHLQYDDWWYAILAYTNSPNAMHHALTRNDETPNLWDFNVRQLVPDANVIANFIACIYVYEDTERPAVKNAHIVEPVKRPKPVKTVAPTETSSTVVTAPSNTSVPKTTPKSNTSTQKYIIKKGDTLSRIAAKHHVTIKDLMRWNHLKNDKIREGQTLIIKK